MGINFTVRDFAYPLSIVKLKRTFNRNQWLSEDALHEYQAARLRQIIAQAYNNIPYYQNLFRENNIVPRDIQSVNDLKNIPFLTKELLRLNFDSLVARNAKRYKPTLVSTSGTTGGKINLYTDKPSNVLEFVHYWRSWGWAGYKLGDTFANLASETFVFPQKRKNSLHCFHYLTRELTINSSLITRRYSDEFLRIFRKFKPLFLKGLPTYLYMFALVINEKKNHGISFKAIFSQGATLLPYQRDFIERVFACRVFDLYGHMERTVAISQCPLGAYHIHLDYGIAELVEPRIPLAGECDGDTCVKEIVGTSLHNFSMPLVRYRTGDYVKLKRSPEKCSCGRGFPVIASVIGRETDVVITPAGIAVTGLFTVFNHTPGVVMAQIIQEKIDRLLVKIVPASEYPDHTDKILRGYLRDFVGDDMDITMEHTTIEGITKDNFGKFKVVISDIPYERILE